MSNNANIHHTDANCRFIRAVEEAFFLLNQDQTRSITSVDFCTIAQSVGKKTELFLHESFFSVP